MLAKFTTKKIEQTIVIMSEKHLHIISYDVPYPVDYGGVFDLYYKIKALSEAGVCIYLHCFEYGRGKQDELNRYCAEVNYYERGSIRQSLFNGVPYIVGSRANSHLLQRLLQDDYPILMEGMHCTYFLHSGDLPANRCFIRVPNVEYKYYEKLAETTQSFAKKMYYSRESKLLKAYEKNLANKATFWTISHKDLKVFTEELGYNNIDNLPLYLPEYAPVFNGEKGSFCLYHGNLAVPENEFAAVWLLENVFNKVEIPFVIAGKNPSKKLEKLAHNQMHTCLVANPGHREMEELIRKAQVNILPSFNETGIKLKLINALYYGRHCLANSSAVEGSGLSHCCTIADSLAEMQDSLWQLWEMPFTFYNWEMRIEALAGQFNNERNARQMIGWIFEGEPTYPGYTLTKRA